VQVADDVAWMIKHSDFVMRRQDTNLSDMKWYFAFCLKLFGFSIYLIVYV